jgi:hypothetical protein
VPPAASPRASLNTIEPFWLLVPPGVAFTLIWSKSSSPEYSTCTPAFIVCRPFTQVVVFESVWIGPDEKAGYGPPSMVLKPAIWMVGILSSISLPVGNT